MLVGVKFLPCAEGTLEICKSSTALPGFFGETPLWGYRV